MIESYDILSKRVNLLRDGFEGRYKYIIRALLNKQFKAVAGRVTADNMRSDLTNIIDEDPLAKLFDDLYTKVGVTFARDSYGNKKAISETELIDRWEKYMKDYARRKAGDRIVSITEMTRKQIRDIIGGAIETATADGLGAEETARLIRKELVKQGREINRWRALRIARTEVGTASSAGSLSGIRALGMPFDKVWIAAGPARSGKERQEHQALHKTAIDGDELFNVGGGMEGPHDPAGGADQVVNCRCTLTYSIRRT